MFRIFFIGCVEFSHTCLQTLITHFHAEKKLEIVGVATKEHSAFNADFCNLAPLCEAAHIPYIYADDINAPRTLEFIRACAPSVIYCFGWSALIKQELLDSYPIIGYHPAALPRNRGRHPLIWALALGLERSASSFFLMDSGADSGDILSQVGFEILPEDNAGSLCKRVEGIAQEQICGFTNEILLRAERVSNSSLGNHSRNPSSPASLRRNLNTPEAQRGAIAQSLAANTRIVCGEIQESKDISESTASDSHSVIASVAKQSIKKDSKSVDCRADKPARNDDKTQSTPHANLESSQDSEKIARAELASARTASHRASAVSHSTQESSHINITKTLHSARVAQHTAPARALDSNTPALESSPLDSRIASNPRVGVSKPSQDPSLESTLESPHSLAAQGFETKLLTGGQHTIRSMLKSCAQWQPRKIIPLPIFGESEVRVMV